jgi:hypothetical protein
MNEQLIGDLFAEATRRMTGSSSREFSEKFAELIVRECAGLFPNVYVEIENEYGHTPVIAADYIKKHFGVEE